MNNKDLILSKSSLNVTFNPATGIKAGKISDLMTLNNRVLVAKHLFGVEEVLEDDRIRNAFFPGKELVEIEGLLDNA